MVNILVPTDFSELSSIAFEYAVGIADTMRGNVTLLHVIDIEQKVKATLRMKTGARDVLNNVKTNLQQMVNNLSAKTEIIRPISFKIVADTTVGEAIEKQSVELHSGLIVMGTKGATGLKKAVVGSNTASLIGTSHIPVLAVPGGARFTGFRNLIYATDMKNLDEELKILTPYIKQFGCTVHILHVVSDASLIEQTEEKIEKAVKKTGYKNFVTIVTFDLDIEGAIGQYITVSRADMLAMFTHKPNFYERVFDKSVTRNMAFNSDIPLLAFKNKK